MSKAKLDEMIGLFMSGGHTKCSDLDQETYVRLCEKLIEYGVNGYEYDMFGVDGYGYYMHGLDDNKEWLNLAILKDVGIYHFRNPGLSSAFISADYIKEALDCEPDPYDLKTIDEFVPDELERLIRLSQKFEETKQAYYEAKDAYEQGVERFKEKLPESLALYMKKTL